MRLKEQRVSRGPALKHSDSAAVTFAAAGKENSSELILQSSLLHLLLLWGPNPNKITFRLLCVMIAQHNVHTAAAAAANIIRPSRVSLHHSWFSDRKVTE